MIIFNTIDAVILCGGLGKRLRPVIGGSPKVMAKIGDRPFLDLILDSLQKQGLQRVILSTGYNADIIEGYYRKKKGDLSIEFSREDIPLGTGGAVKYARNLIKSDPFLVLNGDSFCSVDFRQFIHFHLSKRACGTIVLSKTDETQDFGAITIDHSNKIVNFQEKVDEASTQYVNAGIYCFRNDIFDFMPEEQTFSIEKDFFPKVVQHDLYGFVSEEDFIDIGTPQRYSQAKQLLE